MHCKIYITLFAKYGNHLGFSSLCHNAGMHAWFAAAADTRYAVVAPIIGVQVLSD